MTFLNFGVAIQHQCLKRVEKSNESTTTCSELLLQNFEGTHWTTDVKLFDGAWKVVEEVKVVDDDNWSPHLLEGIAKGLENPHVPWNEKDPE